jgi:tetratricopeptide (TPR) repeat protein
MVVVDAAQSVGVRVPRAVKWIITIFVGVATFGFGWWFCAVPLDMSADGALGVAALLSTLATLPVASWAGRDIAPSGSSPRDQAKEDVAENAVVPVVDPSGADVVQRVIHLQQVFLPPAAAVEPTSGQVVVGPVPREPQHFQQRAAQLGQLMTLAGSGAVAVVCAVTGQRGVGKTQVAGAYARRRVSDGWLVAWIRAESEDLVLSGLAELADALGLRREDEEVVVTAARVRSHLQTRREPALLVFDNVTAPEDILEHLPVAGNVQIVVTSANHAVERIGTPVPVDRFTSDAAVRFLVDTTGVRDETGARALAEELGHLPLALAQAAGRILRTHRGYQGYLERLRRVSIDTYLKPWPGDPYPRGAAEAILLAVEPFTGPDTAEHLALLNLMSVLSPDGISFEVLMTSRDQDQIGELVSALFDASLIEFAGTPANPVAVIHRLTQRVLRERAGDELGTLIEAAATMLSAARFPVEEAWQHRDRGDELVRHIDALWEHISSSMSMHKPRYVLTLRRWAVRQLIESVSLDRAMNLGTAVHADHQAICGEHDPDTLAAAHDLAEAYELSGRFDEAVVLFERTVEARRQVLGAHHRDTLLSANSLAGAYESARRLADAIPLFERTCWERSEFLGTHDPDTITSINDLANVYRLAGRLDEAIPLLEQTLAHRRQQLGDEDPRTLVSVNNLAGAYETAGRVEEAIPLFERTLEVRRRVLGDDHPRTLASANNVAGAYETVRRLDEAIPLFEQTLKDRRRVLGDRHPATNVSVTNLAAVYGLVGRFDEAMDLFEEARAHREDAADEVPSPVGGTARKILLFEETLAQRRRMLGDHHPRTLALACDLAAAYSEAGWVDKATSLYKQTATVAAEVLGTEHPISKSARQSLQQLRASAGGSAAGS